MRRRVRERALGHEQRLAQQGLLLLVATLSGSQMQAERSSSWAPHRRLRRPLLPMQQVSRLHFGTSSPVACAPGPEQLGVSNPQGPENLQ